MQAVERIFSVLSTIAQHPKGLSLSEISDSVGLAKSTTSRFLQSLEAVSAVQRENNAYTIGSGIIALAGAVPGTSLVQALAYPTLLELADKSKETVHLGVREGRKLRYTEQIDTPHRVQLETWLKETYPLHVTAAGKALLAYAAPELIEAYLEEPLEAYSPKSITDAERLREDLEQSKERGYAQTLQEFSEDISGFATAILDTDGKPVASISISIPVFRFPEDKGTAIIQLLQEASLTLAQKLLGQKLLGQKLLGQKLQGAAG